MKILIVDDQQDNVELLVQILEDDYEVITAGSGAECIAQAREQRPDLILLDVMMPGMNGYKTMAGLLEDDTTREIPVIFVSARYRDPDRILKGLDLGAYDYITKPIDDDLLLAKIRAVARMKIATDEHKEKKISYEELYNEAPVAYFTIGMDERILKANQWASEFLGYGIEELVGRPVLDLFSDISFGKSRAVKIMSGFLDGEETRDAECRMVRADGMEKWVTLSLKIIRDPKGKILRGHATVLDITERKEAGKALRESEKKYRSILTAMKDPAYICSPGFRIEYMNPRMISSIGGDAAGEVCHKAIYNNEEKCSWCVFDKIQQGEHAEYEFENPIDNRSYSVTNSPIYNTDKTLSKLTIFRDITDSKGIEAQLRHARKMESIGTLSGGIAHDFNNLLFIITGNTEMAVEDIPKSNPAHAYLEEIKSASFRASDIVKQLINFSRKTNLELKTIDAFDVIGSALKFLRSILPSTVEIKNLLPGGETPILADPTQIQQIMMNICINASKAMEETGGTLEVGGETLFLDEKSASDFSGLIPGNYVKIMVRDTGHGISAEIVDRIFDPYFTTRDIGEGSGMGLAVVHGIVTNHGGDVSVDSKPGKGATFTILLPLIMEKSAIKAEISHEIPPGNETILFVDDEESIAKMIGQMLERIGYRVETRLNPKEALELFRSKPREIDLVITDMTMPQMTGIVFSEKLREIRSDIPVIVCTGHSSLIDEEKSKDLGISAFVMKPVVKSDIAKIIRKVLDRSENFS